MRNRKGATEVTPIAPVLDVRFKPLGVVPLRCPYALEAVQM